MRTLLEIQGELTCLENQREKFPEMKEWSQVEVDVLKWVLGSSRSEKMWEAVK